MIRFKTIKARNFMSVGQTPVEYSLDTHPTTLIVGKNGAGKSLLIEMLVFALYGKPYRNITKGQLINSINGGQSLVEISFETRGNEYRIVRGQKPNIFNLFENGEQKEVGSSVKELQDHIEQNILRMNERAFRQIVVVGSGNYIPFMELSAQQRRGVIEDILGIDIFTRMGVLLKDSMKTLSREMGDIVKEQRTILEKIEMIRKLDSEQLKKNSGYISELNDKISTLSIRQEDLKNDMLLLKGKIEEEEKKLAGKDEVSKKIVEKKSEMFSNGRRKTEAQSTKTFIKSNVVCPSCHQNITDEHKRTILESLDATIASIDEQNKKISNDIDELEASIASFETIERMTKQMRDNGNRMNAERKSLIATIEASRGEIARLESSTTNLSGDTMEKLENDLSRVEKIFEHCKATDNIHNVAYDILSDGGIKQQIIRRYIPFINEQVNTYLDMFGLPVKFVVDEDFNEKILSRYRDAFTFASFSEGQRARIDLAMLLAWRGVATKRNAQTCNILVLDEVFDGSLDSDGVTDLSAILTKLSENGTNVYVISHRDSSLFEKFSRTFEVRLSGQFTKITEMV